MVLSIFFIFFGEPHLATFFLLIFNCYSWHHSQPSSIRCQNSNPQPLSCESSPLTTRPVFPKVRSADLFWSARFSILVCKKKRLAILTKKGSFKTSNFIFMVRETILQILWSAKIFFSVLWSAS